MQVAHGVEAAKTLAVRYEYELVNDGSRLRRMIYPTTDAQFGAGQGRSLWYGYAGTDGIDGAISRVSDVADDAAGSQILEIYDYRGLGTVEDLSRPLSGGQSLESILTFDDFGRTIEADWSTGGQSVDGFAYWYDADSNLLTRQNLTNPNYSQLYHPSGSTANGAYDKLNQIKSYGLGRLNPSTGNTRPTTRPSQIVPSSSQSWGTNAEGNAQRVMPPDDTRDRPIIQGAYTDSEMMSRVESWSREVGSGSKPREALAVRFDAWGNLAKLQGYSVDWWGINTATRTNQSIFGYDAMNRRMAEAHTEAWTRSSTNFYYDLSGQVIEERTWSSKAAEMGITVNSSSRSQYLYSPATGQLILRDLDSDNNPATTGTGLPGGIDQRLYALADAQGNITAITNTSGAVMERYFYSPEGKLLITNGQWQTKDASAYDWRYTYQGGRLDGQGLYYVHGGEWDYRTGDPLKHDPMSYWGEHLSYTPPSLSFFDNAVIKVVPIAVGLALMPLTAGMSLWAGGGADRWGERLGGRRRQQLRCGEQWLARGGRRGRGRGHRSGDGRGDRWRDGQTDHRLVARRTRGSKGVCGHAGMVLCRQLRPRHPVRQRGPDRRLHPFGQRGLRGRVFAGSTGRGAHRNVCVRRIAGRARPGPDSLWKQ